MKAEKRKQKAEMAFCLLLSAFCFSAHAGSIVEAKHAALSTISPLATRIGLEVLRGGGNAIDAAVAVSFALAVAHSQAGNLGGGGFLVYYEAKTKAVWTLDYREVAPLEAKPATYAKDEKAARVGPLAAGVPASVAGLTEMHERFGTRKWADLIAPAIELARGGITVDPELAIALQEAQATRKIDQFPSTAAIFYPDGKPLAAGSKLVQSDLAATLERIAARGDISKKLIENVRAAGGILSYRDLRDYKPIWRAPIRVDFRGFQIYSMPPPSAGALVIGEALNILGGFDLEHMRFQSAEAIHLIAEAERRAYIDRDLYLADPANVRIPFHDLLSNERAKAWRATINPKKSTPTITLSEPGAILEGRHTTHFSIADAEGNVAAVTTTLNDDFGSGFIVPGLGFFLNDSMDDFTIAPGQPNARGLVQANANGIEPGKRMASSMSPVIVMKNGRPFLVLGTRGGPAIPTTILQVLLNVIVWHKSLSDAVAAPRYHMQGVPEDMTYERLRAPKTTVDQLLAMGHGVVAGEAIGDMHAIELGNGKMTAVADPRHGGAAGGY